MIFKKNNIGDEKKQSDKIREKVDELQKEEAKKRGAEKPKYLPDRRVLTVVITAVLCFLIAVGGIYMVSRFRKDHNNNTSGSSPALYSSVESVSSDNTEPTPSSDEESYPLSSSSTTEPYKPDNGEPGYHPIKRPNEPSSTTSSSEHEVSSGSANSRDPQSSVSDIPHSESSSIGVEDIDVGALFH